MVAAPLADLGHRRVKRARVFYLAQLAAFGRDHRVKLLDVSPLGALVESDLALEAGDKVEFIRGGLRLPARVVWTNENRAGLEFMEPVDDEESIRALTLPLAS